MDQEEVRWRRGELHGCPCLWQHGFQVEPRHSRRRCNSSISFRSDSRTLLCSDSCSSISGRTCDNQALQNPPHVMTAKIQSYHVTALVTGLPAFLLRECEHFLACFVLLAHVADVLTPNSRREWATAFCARVCRTYGAGSPDSFDTVRFDSHATSLDASIESRCVLNLGLSYAIAAEDGR